MSSWYRSVSFPQYEVSTDLQIRRRSSGHILKQFNPGSATLYDSGVEYNLRIEELLEEAIEYDEETYTHHQEDYATEDWYQSITFPEYDVSTYLNVRRHSSQRLLSSRRKGVYRIRYNNQTLSVNAIDLLAEVIDTEE